MTLCNVEIVIMYLQAAVKVIYHKFINTCCQFHGGGNIFPATKLIYFGCVLLIIDVKRVTSYEAEELGI